jgi:hypothetical protein
VNQRVKSKWQTGSIYAGRIRNTKCCLSGYFEENRGVSDIKLFCGDTAGINSISSLTKFDMEFFVYATEEVIQAS